MSAKPAELEPHTLSLMISEATVTNRIEEIGLVTSRDYWKRNPLLISIKKGGVVFDNGVAKAARLDGLVFDRGSIGISSYGKKMTSNGAPVVTEPLDVNVVGRDVVLDEDISDTGYTWAFVIPLILSLGAKSARMNVLLWKPSRQVVQGVSLYQVGFEIPDKFVVGTGIDWKEHYREESGIWEVNLTTSAPTS